jgi:hypothetical protein
MFGPPVGICPPCTFKSLKKGVAYLLLQLRQLTLPLVKPQLEQADILFQFPAGARFGKTADMLVLHGCVKVATLQHVQQVPELPNQQLLSSCVPGNVVSCWCFRPGLNWAQMSGHIYWICMLQHRHLLLRVSAGHG